MPDGRENTVSEYLIYQRLRNRTIEYLELASDFSEQIKYQNAVPYVSVPTEVIHQWDDAMDDDVLQNCAPPLFSKDEIKALNSYRRTLNDICAKFPDQMPEINKLQENAYWKELRDSAKETLKVMMRRGPFSDDIEQKEFM